MASAMLINYGTKVRSIIGHLSPIAQQQTNASILFQQNYRSIQKSFIGHKFSTTTSTTTTTTTTSANDSVAAAAGESAINAETQTNDKQAKSMKRTLAVKNVPDNEIKKSVFISQSNDIFTNLALEDWFYRNFDFTNHHVLMLWSNDPCVVVGRHQNPFDETNVSHLQKAGIALARRNSGGGTVFHDRGNLNMTFFTPRERYNRKYNLKIVTRALFREWGIKADISARDDIVINDKKVSILWQSKENKLNGFFVLYILNKCMGG